MASKKNASVKANDSKLSKAADQAALAKREAKNKVRRTARALKKAQALERAQQPAAERTETWAVGTQVEHPAHGRGIVSGHTATANVVLVDFKGEPEAIEAVADELKLVPPLPHKPHTDKAFKFPKRKHAEKVAKNAAQELGTAQEQNAAYAKLARKFSMNDRVVELNGEKREGNVFTVAPEGSGHLDVMFDGETVAQTKFVGDLKKVDMKKHKILIGDLVAFKEAPSKLMGVVESAHFTHGTCLVKVEGREVPVAQLLTSLVLWKAPKPKAETTKFENLPLLSGFGHKGDPYIKVGNTSALRTRGVQLLKDGDAEYPMVLLSVEGRSEVVEKVRLKKDTIVTPMQVFRRTAA